MTCKYFLPTLPSIIKFFYCAVCWKEFLYFDVVRSIIFVLWLVLLKSLLGNYLYSNVTEVGSDTFSFIFLSNLECFFVHRVSRVGINFIILIMWKRAEFPIAFPVEDEPRETLSGQQKKKRVPWLNTFEINPIKQWQIHFYPTYLFRVFNDCREKYQ